MKRIVSPGVFTREKRFIFFPQRISEIGAEMIGFNSQRKVFVPTQITNFGEFENIFGGLIRRFYVPYSVKEYLRSVE